LGLLARRDLRLAHSVSNHFAIAHPKTVTALNQPYEIGDLSDYTIPIHGEQRESPHLLIEIRNDLIGDSLSVAAWADSFAVGMRRIFTAWGQHFGR